MASSDIRFPMEPTVPPLPLHTLSSSGQPFKYPTWLSREVFPAAQLEGSSVPAPGQSEAPEQLEPRLESAEEGQGQDEEEPFPALPTPDNAVRPEENADDDSVLLREFERDLREFVDPGEGEAETGVRSGGGASESEGKKYLFEFERLPALVDYKLQGDLSMYTEAALNERQALRSHPKILAAIGLFWRTYRKKLRPPKKHRRKRAQHQPQQDDEQEALEHVEQQGQEKGDGEEADESDDSDDSDDDYDNRLYVPKEEYINVHIKMQKAVDRHFQLEEAQARAEEDWKHDLEEQRKLEAERLARKRAAKLAAAAEVEKERPQEGAECEGSTVDADQQEAIQVPPSLDRGGLSACS